MRQIDPPAKVVSQVAGRFLMELDLAESLQGLLYYYGYYERDLTRFIESIIRPGSVMVDVGANIGTFTLLAASLGATCYSFEASPTVCATLRRNIALNEFGTLPCANAPSPTTLERPPSSSMRTLAKTTPADRAPSSVADQEGRSKSRSKPSIRH